MGYKYVPKFQDQFRVKSSFRIRFGLGSVPELLWGVNGMD